MVSVPTIDPAVRDAFDGGWSTPTTFGNYLRVL